jgi:hypothetical protein
MPSVRESGTGLRPLLLVAACQLISFGWGQDGTVYAERPHLIAYGTLHSTAFAPDGRTVATAGAAGAVLWDLGSGEPLAFLEVPVDNRTWAPGHAAGLVFSPDQQALYALYGWYECGPGFSRVVRWSLPNGDAEAWPSLAEAVEAEPGLPAHLEASPCQIGWGWHDEIRTVARADSETAGADEPRPLHLLLRDAGFELGELQQAQQASWPCPGATSCSSTGTDG